MPPAGPATGALPLRRILCVVFVGHGIVPGFLAEDVSKRLDEVLNAIHRALAHRSG
jgi:hypothetical protein